MSGIDTWGDAVPNWIAALSTFGALVAASAAGIYARRAAHSAREQAVAVKEQVRLQELALEDTKAQALAARAEAEEQGAAQRRAETRVAEARLDALAPSLFVRVAPGPGDGISPLWSAHERGEFLVEWRATFEENERPRFRTELRLTFRNVSRVPARIDITNFDGGTIDGLPQGTPLYVLPGRNNAKTLYWNRVVNAIGLSTDDQVGSPERAAFRLEFWVRDIGMNVRDTYRFSLGLPFFERDGSRLVADPSRAQWSEVAAVPVERVYERLTASEATETKSPQP
ncbi:hypothetical protein [Leifsonia xyli]|uniref:hypothetical protein n=1 Tax=Leifsonia xyli TaxID=1575 RepID=UPI0012FD2B23